MGRFRRARNKLGVVAVLIATAILGTALAQATTSSKQGFTTTATATVSPVRLPADRTAPVTLDLSIRSTRTTPGTPPNLRLMGVKARTDRQITVDTEGLPACDPVKTRLGEADLHEARKLCGNALVGTGSGRTVQEFPEQGRHEERFSVLVFNTLAQGKPQLLFFYIFHGGIEEAGIPILAGEVREFTFGRSDQDRTASDLLQIEIGARWKHRGRWHSYLNASCRTGTIKNLVTIRLSNGSVSNTAPQRCTKQK